MKVREHIIARAQELMYHKGYVAMSISDIMAAAAVGKGQLYHYFSSKKEIGLAATDLILNNWRITLFEQIFGSSKPAEAKFAAMLDWVSEFHEEQTTYYGCPVGNLIVELSAGEEDFRVKLNRFMNEWTDKLTALLQELHPEWEHEKAALEASQVIASIQGSIVLLKVSQNIDVLESSMMDLKEKYIG